MARIRFLLLPALLIFLASCEKDPIEDRFRQDIMIIDEDLSRLALRVGKIEGGRLMPIYPVDFDGTLKSQKCDTPPKRYEIYLRAEVAPPVYKGKTLQASHIKIVGNNAFVTYNTRGEEFLGGVDVFDVTDIENPTLIQGVIFPEKDISSIDIDPLGAGNNNFIYLTGAYSPDINELGLRTPAVVERFIANKANQFKHIGEERNYFDLESYAGNDVRHYLHDENRIFVTSGSGGGLSIMGTDLTRRDYIPIPYARSIDTDGTRLVVYSAENNRLIVMDMDGAVQREIETGGDHFVDGKYLEAKSIVRLKGDLAFVAAGTGGMEVFNILTGEKTGSLPRPEVPQGAEFPLNYVTNGVSVNNNLILVANGGSGVHIAGHCDKEDIYSIGKFMFEYGSSANFIEARENKVFVATGIGGLKILEIVELEPSEPCATLWPNIVELFPERHSIHEEGHPAHELSAAGLPGTIELLEDGPVYITFIHNGAGWHNQFGYYAYHKDDVPTSPDELEKHIIYQYVNQNSNNEQRNQGERVRLGSDGKIFPAGTIIGFYIIADGWDPIAGKEREEEDIRHIVYTTPEFNPGGVRKHVLFLEQSCLDIVLGFEDMLEKSDEDFNDIIFTISNGYDAWGNEHNQYLDKSGLPIK